MDPALAAAAVSASDSTASRALLPFSVRRSAVLAALNTGLYTLKWLRDWRDNVLGSVRVRALQKLIEGGKSLPLIFPEADLEYRYNKGGVVVSPTGACATSAAVIPKKSSAQDGPQLHVGARVPHCWLAPPTEDKSKASLTYVVSTVQLPALADGLNGVSSSSRSIDDTETVHKTCIPTCTIIVDEKHADFVVSALQKVSSNCTKLFCVVAVSESTSSADTHETLQETFQDPRYHVEGDQQQQRTDSSPPSPAREESLAESSTFDARFKGVLSGEEKVDWYASNSGINCLALVDVGGSWKAHTQSYLHDHYGKTSSAHSLAVIVRPDGHVASIVAIQESADVDDEIHLFADAVLDVAKVLHFVV